MAFEDPIRLINRTAGVGLRETVKMPWLRVYGSFKNSGLADLDYIIFQFFIHSALRDQ